jgi:hypothetical protein
VIRLRFFARYMRGARVSFLLNFLRLIQSQERSEGPFLILVSMTCKNSCIVFKERPSLYIAQARICRVVEQEAFEGLIIYLMIIETENTKRILERNILENDLIVDWFV